MTALQLTNDIYHNINIIAEDEGMLNRVAKYVRRLAKQKTEDPTLMTKEEFFTKLDEAEEEIRQGQCTTFSNKAEMNAWLNAL